MIFKQFSFNHVSFYAASFGVAKGFNSMLRGTGDVKPQHFYPGYNGSSYDLRRYYMPFTLIVEF